MSIEGYLKQKGLSESTIRCYLNEINEFKTWCSLQDMVPDYTGSTDVTAYLKYLQAKGQQNSTRNINLTILSHYYNYLITTGIRDDNPAKLIKISGAKTQKLYPIFSTQELDDLYSQYVVFEETDARNNRNWFGRAKLNKQRNKVILSLMVNQGLATDEVNGLTVSDVKLKEGIIYIAGARKSNARTLVLKSSQIMELMEYQLTTRKELLQQFGRSTDLFFLPVLPVGSFQLVEETKDCTNIWKRLSEEVRLYNKKFINFQQVRASVITHWLKQYNLRQVQYMAGHRYVSSTEAFLVNQIEDLQQDIDELHPLT